MLDVFFTQLSMDQLIFYYFDLQIHINIHRTKSGGLVHSLQKGKIISIVFYNHLFKQNSPAILLLENNHFLVKTSDSSACNVKTFGLCLDFTDQSSVRLLLLSSRKLVPEKTTRVLDQNAKTVERAKTQTFMED